MTLYFFIINNEKLIFLYNLMNILYHKYIISNETKGADFPIGKLCSRCSNFGIMVKQGQSVIIIIRF